MRKKGKIVFWNGEKAYGFIEPMGGGKQVFVHITAFKSKTHPPSISDSVSFKLGRDNDGRLNAQQVLYADQQPESKASGFKKEGGGIVTYWMLVLYLILFIASTKVNDLPVNLLYWQLVISLIAFGVYAWDKFAAKAGRWRTSEKTLHLLSLAGGWPGALLAHKWLRHKSAKQSFRRVFWMTVVMSIAALLWLHTDDGRRFLHQNAGITKIERSQ